MRALDKAGARPEDASRIFSVSTTGISTPSLDSWEGFRSYGNTSAPGPGFSTEHVFFKC